MCDSLGSNTRVSVFNVKQSIKSKIKRSAFLYTGEEEWNKTPNEIKSAQSLNSFKKLKKLWFILKKWFICNILLLVLFYFYNLILRVFYSVLFYFHFLVLLRNRSTKVVWQCVCFINKVDYFVLSLLLFLFSGCLYTWASAAVAMETKPESKSDLLNIWSEFKDKLAETEHEALWLDVCGEMHPGSHSWHLSFRLVSSWAVIGYLVQVQLDLVSSLQTVGCSHLVDHVPPRQDHCLHREQHLLQTWSRHTCGQSSPGHAAATHDASPAGWPAGCPGWSSPGHVTAPPARRRSRFGPGWHRSADLHWPPTPESDRRTEPPPTHGMLGTLWAGGSSAGKRWRHTGGF